MSIRVLPAALRSAARLTSRIGEIGRVSKGNPWRGAYRLAAEGGRLVLTATDGSSTLRWSITADGDLPDPLDECIEASSFDALARRLSDGNPYEVATGGGVVLTQVGASSARPEGGTTRLRLPSRTCPAFPPRALADGPDVPGRPCVPWTVPSTPLARALEFVAPFIDADNPVGSRSVATWTTDGRLVGGSLKKLALVRGLPAARTPLTFGRRAARAIAAFLEGLQGEVEVRSGGAHYSFTCASAGHVFEVRGEPAPFPVQLLGTGDSPRESYLIDRKTFLNSVAILEVLLPAPGADLEFRIKGQGENAGMRLSTPGTADTQSSDVFPLIRCATPLEEPPQSPPTATGGRPSEILFWAKGDLVREVLNGMGTVTLTCHLERRNRRLLLSEAPQPGELVRSVHLSVLMPREDEERGRSSSASAGGPASVADAEVPPGVTGEGPPDIVSAVDGGSRHEHQFETRPA